MKLKVEMLLEVEKSNMSDIELTYKLTDDAKKFFGEELKLMDVTILEDYIV